MGTEGRAVKGMGEQSKIKITKAKAALNSSYPWFVARENVTV